MKLDPRLAACAELVDANSITADIGTDHAMLPIWLVENGISASAAAADIRKGPLEAAEKNIRRAGLEGKISTYLSDGLENVPPENITHIVIAGMGGETIAGILERCGWIEDRTLILQPMSKSDELRCWLYRNGWDITKEIAAASGKFIYTVMKCRFCGKAIDPTAFEAAVGKLDPNNADAKLYLEKKAAALEKSGAGRLESGDQSGKKLIELADDIKAFLTK